MREVTLGILRLGRREGSRDRVWWNAAIGAPEPRAGLRGDLEVHLSGSRMGGLVGPARCHAGPPGRPRSLLSWGKEGRELEASLYVLGSLSKGLNPLLENPGPALSRVTR